MNYDRRQIKENAKAAMAAANPRPWLVTLVFLALLAVVPGAITAMIPSPSSQVTASLGDVMENIDHIRREEFLMALLASMGVSMVFSVPASIITALFRALMGYGYAGYSLEVYRRDSQAGVGSLFKSFPKFAPVIGSAFLVGVFSFLWGLLVYGVYGVMVLITVLVQALTGEVGVWVWVLLALLFFVAALVHSLIVCRYCLTPYFAMARGEKAADSVIASVRTMRGNIWKRFVLSLSFLGWKLLLLLIGFLVAFVGSVLAFLVFSRSLVNLVDLFEAGRVSYGNAAGPILLNLTGMILPFVMVVIVTALVKLPLKLWLTAYENISYAGFFQALAGEPEDMAPEAGAQEAEDYFHNVQPAVPVLSAVPAAAPYTPFDKGPVEVPAAAVEEALAAPDAPAEEVTTVPVEISLAPEAAPAPMAEVPAVTGEPQPPAAPEEISPAGGETPDEPEN